MNYQFVVIINLSVISWFVSSNAVASQNLKNIPQVKGNCSLGQSSRYCSPFDYCVEPSSKDAVNVSEPIPTAVMCPAIWMNGWNCYNSSAICEVQSNGKCGWTNSGVFANCLLETGAQPAAPIDPATRVPTQLDGCKAVAQSFCGPRSSCVEGSDPEPTLQPESVCARTGNDVCFETNTAVCRRDPNTKKCEWNLDISGSLYACLNHARSPVFTTSLMTIQPTATSSVNNSNIVGNGNTKSEASTTLFSITTLTIISMFSVFCILVI